MMKTVGHLIPMWMYYISMSLNIQIVNYDVLTRFLLN